MKSATFALTACAVVAFAGFSFADGFTGPTSTFYLNAGGERFAMIQGTTVTFVNWAYDGSNSTVGEAMLAASQTDGVSTAPSEQTEVGGTGGLYSLAGVSSGIANLAPIVPAVDGTSDGTFNYYVKNGGNDDVFQSNLDWSNPTVLFSTTSVGTFQGIAYDSINNSLWMSQSGNSNEIADFSMTGTLLSSFIETSTNSVAALGFDPADGTLWGEYGQTGKMGQWDTNGTLIQEGTPSGITSGLHLSGDFAEGSQLATPEPATLLLVFPGVFALIRRFRKK